MLRCSTKGLVPSSLFDKKCGVKKKKLINSRETETYTMLKIPKNSCGSSEEEGGAPHDVLHLTVMTKTHNCLWEY